MSTKYPLLFEFRTPVLGEDFVAVVTMKGATLVVEESPSADCEQKSFWAYGVYPGALAAEGNSIESAYYALKETLLNVLLDMALEYDTFDALKTEVERFFYQCDDETMAEFEAARAAVRSGEVQVPHLKTQSHPQFTVDVAFMKKAKPLSDGLGERALAA